MRFHCEDTPSILTFHPPIMWFWNASTSSPETMLCACTGGLGVANVALILLPFHGCPAQGIVHMLLGRAGRICS